MNSTCDSQLLLGNMQNGGTWSQRSQWISEFHDAYQRQMQQLHEVMPCSRAVALERLARQPEPNYLNPLLLLE